jgi:L-ornithine N5-oxygenase
MLAGLSDHLTFDQEGYLAINEDYSLVTAPDDVPPIFLNGICESSHGIGDSGSFSLLSLRAAAIARGYLAWKGRRHKAAREMEDSTA